MCPYCVCSWAWSPEDVPYIGAQELYSQRLPASFLHCVLLACWGSCSYPEPSVLAPLPLQVDPSGEIIELEKGGCPWKEHLYQLESGLSPAGTITFVIYTDQAGQWRVQCVPKEPHSFQSR